MRLALDSNRYTDLTAGDADIATLVEVAAEVAVPFVVVAELRAGFAIGRRAVENEAILTRFLGKPGVSLLLADAETTHVYAALYRQLRVQGTPIPTNDLWIGALVVQHGLTLATRDAHFAHLAQIQVV